jgi:hypothetical protein
MLTLAVLMIPIPRFVFATDPESVTTFSDVKAGYWAKAQIEEAVRKGYVSGFPDGTFKPEQKVSRAEFIRMLVDALKLPHVEQGTPWYQPYVAAVIETGIHRESDFKTEYDQPLTRLEMVRLAVRASNADLDASPNAKDDMWLVFRGTETGILAGVGAGKLDLQGTSTRAQAVAIIERILSVKAGKKLAVDKYAMSAAELAWHRTNVFTVMPEYFRTQFPDEVERGVDPIENWDVSKMTVTTKDGLYKGTMDQIVAIDLSDPKDPNRYLLGDISKLKWYAGGPIRNGVAEGYPVKDQPNSYIIYFDGHLDYNKDKKKYYDQMPEFGVLGENPKDSEELDYYNGKLNLVSRVFLKAFSDFPAVIVPKSTTVQFNDLAVLIFTPSYNGVVGQDNRIVRVAGPQGRYYQP